MSIEYAAGLLVGLLGGALIGIIVGVLLERREKKKATASGGGRAENVDDEGEELFDRWKCVICGCTDDNACEGGCYWVYPNLCSACAEKIVNGGYDFEEVSGNE